MNEIVKVKRCNFGCGMKEDWLEGYDNVDNDDFDFNVFPYPVKDNYYDEILTTCVIEHMNDIWETLKELHRIMKPNARLIIITAHHNCEPSYNSLQHKCFFNEMAFKEFIIRNPNLFKIEELKVKPTVLGSFFPEFIRNYLARHIGHLKGEITCIFIKTNQKA